ncbi:hypothetical protein BC937DRAFT_90996 [Endogone sp. FLAS-F59071]|nr:hypothetical protein BC937DRAFT_90996 [Endogone sp. FLAS-F59071]|eukprot:RUS21934.1 hypothetical protein BC937DRAFT_90996 [Endogone sp. FLAS-F59071]
MALKFLTTTFLLVIVATLALLTLQTFAAPSPAGLVARGDDHHNDDHGRNDHGRNDHGRDDHGRDDHKHGEDNGHHGH